jgi:hypothetical protein
MRKVATFNTYRPRLTNRFRSFFSFSPPMYISIYFWTFVPFFKTKKGVLYIYTGTALSFLTAFKMTYGPPCIVCLCKYARFRVSQAPAGFLALRIFPQETERETSAAGAGRAARRRPRGPLPTFFCMTVGKGEETGGLTRFFFLCFPTNNSWKRSLSPAVFRMD